MCSMYLRQKVLEVLHPAAIRGKMQSGVSRAWSLAPKPQIKAREGVQGPVDILTYQGSLPTYSI